MWAVVPGVDPSSDFPGPEQGWSLVPAPAPPCTHTHTRSQTDPGPGLTSLPRRGQSEGVLSRGPHARMGNGHWPLSRLQVPLGEPEAPPSSGEAAQASNLPSILISGPNACWAAATLFW